MGRLAKIVLSLMAISAFPLCAEAQNVTSVSGTVKDSNGVPYASATVQAQLLPTGVTPTVPAPCNGQSISPCVVSAFQRGSTDVNGNFSMNLASNAVLSPGGTQWQFTVNTSGAPPPLGTGPQTCTATLTISGASQSISSSFSSCPALGNTSGGNPTSANLIDPTSSTYGAKADGVIGADGTTTNTSNNFSSTSTACASTDIGKLAVVVNASTGVYPFGSGLVTVTGCNGNAWVLSGTASQSIAGTANWAIGTDNGTALQTAYTATFVTGLLPGKILALPCGVMVVAEPPFVAPSTYAVMQQRPDIQGCNSTGGSTFVLHPHITAGLLAAGGTIFADGDASPSNPPGGITAAGLGGNAKIENISMTTLSGLLPSAAFGFSFFNRFQMVRVIQGQLMGMASGFSSLSFIQMNSGEGYASRINFQNWNTSGGQIVGVAFQSQGINTLTDSIFAFGGIAFASTCAATTFCNYINDYITGTNQGFQCAGCTALFVGNSISVAGGSGSNGAIYDNGVASTIYAFGNPLITTSQVNFPAIKLTNAASVLDMSGTNLTSNTAGCQIAGSGQVNDRAGNTPFVLNGTGNCVFSGKYVPIGGGSVATNSSSAATNFGVTVSTPNIVTNSPGTSTYDVKIGFRQVTAGVGCGAGSNTVNGVLSWTAGGAAQATGSNGVPALATLTISANGSVGSSSVYTSIPVHADVNTAITFTTTSVLASAGCSTTPQYVVDFSNI